MAPSAILEGKAGIVLFTPMVVKVYVERNYIFGEWWLVGTCFKLQVVWLSWSDLFFLSAFEHLSDKNCLLYLIGKLMLEGEWCGWQMKLMYECKYCWSFLVVVGCACCFVVVIISIAGGLTPTSNWLCVIKCKTKPPCHTGGCRNTWQYDTYYQHCWWESFVRTYGEDKGGWPDGGG